MTIFSTMKKFLFTVCTCIVTMTGTAQSQKISASLDMQMHQATASTAHRVAINVVGEMPIMVGNYVTRNVYPLLVSPDITADFSKKD